MKVQWHNIRDFYLECLDMGDIETYSKLTDIFLLHSGIEDTNNYITITYNEGN